MLSNHTKTIQCDYFSLQSSEHYKQIAKITKRQANTMVGNRALGMLP